ncbi:MAG: glycosyltransferase family 2 protein [Oscillospiraceae bacterium]|jgi:dolichol-phosphate mannosyltransferase|nr:glycosyltransferase family 2 protein [Oscillospiraceae bacterium]
MLSVVIPAYNEEEMIALAAFEISDVLKSNGIEYELIFVDDGSTDGTWTGISCEAKNSPHIRGLRFSRNFGKEAAIFAGLKSAKGDCVAVMDCDLQHPPKTLIAMYNMWEDGFEVVEGVKSSRGKESFLYKMSAKLFYSAISAATKVDMNSASDFKLLGRRAVDALIEMPERGAFFRALSSWIGFRTVSVPFEVAERARGESKWSTWKLMKYALTNIASFTSAPMQIVWVIGVLFFIGALVLGVQSLYMKFSGKALGGFTTVIIIELIIGAATMLSLGIIGSYIARIYEEIKCRPRYIVSETAASDDD